MNKVITTVNKKNAKAKVLALTLLNHLAAGMGSISVILAFTFIALGVIWWKIVLFVAISLIPAALLFLFKGIR